MFLRILIASTCVLLVAGLLVAEDSPESVERHCLRVQVLLLESSNALDEEMRGRLSGPTDEVMKTVSKLEKEQNASIINHVDMSVLDDCECMLQIGETAAIRTGTTRLGSGREQASYQDVNTGTIVQLRTQVSGEQVMIEIDFSKSGINPRDEESDVPQGVSQLTHQTTIQVQDGHAMPVGRMMQRSGDQSKAFLFVVSAEILKSSNVQVMKFQSFSRTPAQGAPAMESRVRGSASGSMAPARPSSSRPSSEAVLERSVKIAESMFKRADKNQDGVISQDEVGGLRPRAPGMEPPIKQDQYADWFASYLESMARRSSARGNSSSGFRRPPASPRPGRADRAVNDSEDADRKTQEGEAEAEAVEQESDGAGPA